MKALLLAALLQTAPGVLVNGRPPVDPGTTAQVTAQQAQINNLMMAQSQSVDATLDANGDFTWVYPVAFTNPPRIAYFPQNPNKGQPIVCNWQTRTATPVTFHCDKAVGALSALLLPLFNDKGAAGAVVTVTARGTLIAPVAP